MEVPGSYHAPERRTHLHDGPAPDAEGRCRAAAAHRHLEPFGAADERAQRARRRVRVGCRHAADRRAGHPHAELTVEARTAPAPWMLVIRLPK